MSNPLTKIVARAKQIHKTHPGKKWTDCIKAASRELKGSTKSKPAKKKVHKKTVMRKKHTAAHRPARKKHTGTGHLVTRLKDHYKTQLADQLLKRDLAKTKRDKKKISKKVIEVRGKLKKLM